MTIAPSRHGAWILCVASSLLAPQSWGQERYDLGDDDSWLLVESTDPATPEGQLALARRALADGQFERARDLADQWIERNPRHNLLALAYLTRADAKYRGGDEYKALFDYEYIARMHPGSEVFMTTLRRELEIARAYAGGKKRKLWGMRIVGAKSEAEELFIRVQERAPGSTIAEEAGMELGDFYFERGDMTLAAEAYDLYIENYPNSERVTTARSRLIAAHLATVKGAEFDAAGLYNARERLREMRVVEPAAAERLGAEGLLAGIDERDALKMLTTAKWYLKVDDVIAAELTIRRLVNRYERTTAASDALRLIPDVLVRMAADVRAPLDSFYREKRQAHLGIEDLSEAETPPSEPAPDEPARTGGAP